MNHLHATQRTPDYVPANAWHTNAGLLLDQALELGTSASIAGTASQC